MASLNSLLNTIFQVASRVWQREPRILVRTSYTQFDIFYTTHHKNIVYVVINPNRDDGNMKIILNGQVIVYDKMHQLIKAIMDARSQFSFGQNQDQLSEEYLVEMMTNMCF